jgi:hypothetical protein
MRMLHAVALAAILAIPATVRAEQGTPESDTSSTRENPPVTQAQLRGLLEGMHEQVTTMQADLDKVKKLKFSGYVQVRAEVGEGSSDSVKVTGASSSSAGTFTTANVSRFYIRRGRLKLIYDSSPLSQAMIYLDGGTDRTVRLLEASITLLDPWTTLHDHRLTVGQFSVPFGYEIERSSSVRELPERSRAENVLFSGERDRGIKLESQWTPRLKTTVALLNGGGINSADFPNTDPTRGKDLVARARWSQGAWDAAASYYFGHQTTPLTGPDIETDRTRLGFDTQVFYSAPALGGGSLRAEIYAGHDANTDSLKSIVVAVTSGATGGARVLAAGRESGHVATDVRGGYLMLVQNLGERAQFVARYDRWDPDTNKEHDQYERLGFGVNAFYDGFTRLTVSYDAISTETSAGAGRWRDPRDNLWTFQLQHKF